MVMTNIRGLAIIALGPILLNEIIDINFSFFTNVGILQEEDKA